MSTKIYDATKVSREEVDDLWTKACYFGDTKEEVRNKENAGVLISLTEDGFRFAGMFGNYRYMCVSAELTKFKTLASVLGREGERMIKGYYSFLRSIGC